LFVRSVFFQMKERINHGQLPHCARKLRLFDWRPQCPGCGVNLMFYGFEKRFYEDTKLSELSMAAARARLKRFKASFNGSMPAKLRIFTCFLPLAALLLPMGVLRADLPFAEKQWSAGLLGLLGLLDMDMRGFGELPWLRLMLQSEQAVLFAAGISMGVVRRRMFRASVSCAFAWPPWAASRRPESPERNHNRCWRGVNHTHANRTDKSAQPVPRA